ncbi:MAG TPA: DNA repair protein RadC [Nannocystis exedens]|nr:DNA repair protein RadC [Nannocystis exedens]
MRRALTEAANHSTVLPAIRTPSHPLATQKPIPPNSTQDPQGFAVAQRSQSRPQSPQLDLRATFEGLARLLKSLQSMISALPPHAPSFISPLSPISRTSPGRCADMACPPPTMAGKRPRQSPVNTPELRPRPAPIERPRERLLVLGAGTLADVELLALVLGGSHAVERATLLLRTLGGLAGLAKALPQELLRVPGIGEASAGSITAALELARRLGRLHLPYRQPLHNTDAFRRFARSALQGASQEVFMVIGLDARLRVQLVRNVGKGTVAAVTVHPREIFRPLIRAGVHSTLLVHNHPSGDTQPSRSDLELTERLVDVGWLLGIPVLDHLIVSDCGDTSFVEAGIMPSPTALGEPGDHEPSIEAT